MKSSQNIIARRKIGKCIKRIKKLLFDTRLKKEFSILVSFGLLILLANIFIALLII